MFSILIGTALFCLPFLLLALLRIVVSFLVAEEKFAPKMIVIFYLWVEGKSQIKNYKSMYLQTIQLAHPLTHK